MRLTVFGASGGVGREVIRQAKGAQHEVTAVVRDLSRAPDGVTAIRADLASDDVTAAADAVARSDDVISCLGASSKSDIGVAAQATRAVVKAMAASDVRRIIAISAAPVARLRAARAGPRQPSTGDDMLARLVLYPVIGRLFRSSYADLAEMEDVLLASGLEWTVVRPPRLTNGPGTGSYRTAMDQNLPHGRWISRADLADLLLKLLDQPATVQHAVGVAY